MKPGDSVTCINATGSGNMLRRLRTYTVAALGPAGHIYVDGVPVLYPGFWTHRFVKTDISELTALLTQPKETFYGAQKVDCQD